MKLTAGQPLTLKQLAYMVDLEPQRNRRVRTPADDLLDELVETRGERDRARRVSSRLRGENKRLRNLLRTIPTTSGDMTCLDAPTASPRAAAGDSTPYDVTATA